MIGKMRLSEELTWPTITNITNITTNTNMGTIITKAIITTKKSMSIITIMMNATSAIIMKTERNAHIADIITTKTTIAVADITTMPTIRMATNTA